MRGSWRMRKLFLALLLVCLLVLLTLLIDFNQRTYSNLNTKKLPLVGVVFTGQYSRVDAGLYLLETGVINRLIVSGVNGGAGLSTETFGKQFIDTPVLKEKFAAGDVLLATGANTTWENALETACLLSDTAVYGDDAYVLLITSKTHMPRASLLLEAALPDRQILRWTVLDAENTRSYGMTEFKKYLLARGMVLYMRIFSVRQWQSCGDLDDL